MSRRARRARRMKRAAHADAAGLLNIRPRPKVHPNVANNVLRSPAVIIGGVLALVATTACVCGAFNDDDDDDDCGLGTTSGTVFAAGTSLRMAEPPAASAEMIPASGGFGTHLASCGG